MRIAAICSEETNVGMNIFLGLIALGTVLDIATDILRKFGSPVYRYFSSSET